jgi:hypothetical protein
MIVDAVVSQGPGKPRKHAKRTNSVQPSAEVDPRVTSKTFVWEYRPDDVVDMRIKVGFMSLKQLRCHVMLLTGDWAR